ncbi:monovalent cation/H+ antiporter complex subunit F [Aquisalimonas sp.]|uniref:monovalent cation/H+ antiporter complex subunit F n=1 Tax=unclassified Aquisalimonas TaxID=2644645 RepID=UPI0025B8A983|nr:monovalent cation/H+ antiporter complex subunit F [Aquisalimonas sp.]
MNELFLILAVVLLLNTTVGLVRILSGPHPADRMLAAEMFSTSAVVIMLLLAFATDRPPLVDVALVFALLSALAVVTFVSRAWSALKPTTDTDDHDGGNR